MKPTPDNLNFLGLRTAIYHVPDLARGKVWYSKVLGIEPYFDQPFYVGFNVGGYELGLDPDPSSSAGAGAGGVVVYWGVSDADAALNRLLSLGASERTNVQNVGVFTDVRDLQRQLKAKGVALQTEADETSMGPASFMVVDPDGNPILVDQHV